MIVYIQTLKDSRTSTEAAADVQTEDIFPTGKS